MSKKTSMGTCPKCGSDDIEYYDFEVLSEIMTHYCHCNKCDLYFREFEFLTYDGYEYEDEDGTTYTGDSTGTEW